jgi:hypothetical protein
MNQVNKASISASKDALIEFLWNFHNSVNRRTKSAFFPKEGLEIYKTANTQNVVKHFISIMTAVANNEKTMLFGFHRALYMKQFTTYIQQNINKYNP